MLLSLRAGLPLPTFDVEPVEKQMTESKPKSRQSCSSRSRFVCRRSTIPEPTKGRNSQRKEQTHKGRNKLTKEGRNKGRNEQRKELAKEQRMAHTVASSEQCIGINGEGASYMEFSCHYGIEYLYTRSVRETLALTLTPFRRKHCIKHVDQTRSHTLHSISSLHSIL
jgi:hypothetical protein